MTADLLPSWRTGPTKAALVEFLAVSNEIPPEQRLAVFDNDGTLWCEKPRYTQVDFFIHELEHMVQDRPVLREVPEYKAVLDRDLAAIDEFGLERVLLALVALFEMIEPEVFEARVNHFLDETTHPDSGRRYDEMVYQPMLELLGALEAHGFTNAISTGGGAEFVRAVSQRLYGVAQERVVGSLVTYVQIQKDGRPTLVRTNRPQGEINEAETKVANIQLGLGRRAVFAAGNSPGDTAMLEYTSSGDGPTMSLLVNHDDAEREYAYRSEAGVVGSDEPVRVTADRLGWAQVSMRDDWAVIFPAG